MVYYEETKLINNWQLDRVLVLSSAEAPPVEKRRENGELKNRGREEGALRLHSLCIQQGGGGQMILRADLNFFGKEQGGCQDFS